MNFPTISSFTVPLIAKKAPIAVVYPEEPQLASARDAAVVAGAPHPRAARLFLNWIMSLEATRLYCSVSAVAIVGDPEGKAGCLPSQKAHEVNFNVSDEHARALTRDLGLNQEAQPFHNPHPSSIRPPPGGGSPSRLPSGRSAPSACGPSSSRCRPCRVISASRGAQPRCPIH
jgi:hypothetical protein